MPVVVDQSLSPGLGWIRLAGPRANILDSEMVEALRTAIRELAADSSLKAFLFDALGPDFSFGSSVKEHERELAGRMLESFHGLFRDLIREGLPTLVVLRGRVLGGGLEFAAFANRVFAAPSSLLAQPEIKLGVFAPVASLILPRRVGQARADDMLLTGRELNAAEALAAGLVDHVSDDPLAAALDYYQTHLQPLSAFSLRRAQRAAHLIWDQEFLKALPTIEDLYLQDLMRGDDPQEGIAAFLEKRPAQWRDS